ncbi:MAG TPA: hypothetical protein VGF45_14580, partial [Polyangia bacterium]
LWSPCQKKGGSNPNGSGMTPAGGGDSGGCSFVQSSSKDAGTRSALALLVPLFAVGSIIRRRRRRA